MKRSGEAAEFELQLLLPNRASGWGYWTKFEPPRSRELILKLVQPEGGLANLRTGTLPVAEC